LTQAHLYLGRARLMMNDRAGAEASLSFVVENEGPRSAEAAALLSVMKQEGARSSQH
jgi:hypothetical protein